MDAVLPHLRPTQAAPGVAAREAWLQPFQPPAQPRTLRARVRREEGRLTVRYVLEGCLDDLELPRPQPPARRLDGLWRATCFEAFLARPGDEGYHEFNLSPAGHWACYAFSGPRTDMRLATGLAGLDWKTHRVPGHLAIRFTVELRQLDRADQVLELGLSAVLARRDGGREHWALAHVAERPDFHQRGSFLLRLP
jgi:hypothetical protein